MFLKILFCVILAVITVLSISIVDFDCSVAVYYLFKAWLLESGTAFVSKSHRFLIGNFVINVLLVAAIYFGLLYKINKVAKKYVLISIFIMMLSVAWTYFQIAPRYSYELYGQGSFNWYANGSYGELRENKIGFFLKYKNDAPETCIE